MFDRFMNNVIFSENQVRKFNKKSDRGLGREREREREKEIGRIQNVSKLR